MTVSRRNGNKRVWDGTRNELVQSRSVLHGHTAAHCDTTRGTEQTVPSEMLSVKPVARKCCTVIRGYVLCSPRRVAHARYSASSANPAHLVSDVIACRSQPKTSQDQETDGTTTTYLVGSGASLEDEPLASQQRHPRNSAAMAARGPPLPHPCRNSPRPEQTGWPRKARVGWLVDLQTSPRGRFRTLRRSLDRKKNRQ